MQTTASVLRQGIEGRDGELILTLDPAFQGLPGTAHGGSVLGALDLVAGIDGPREIAGVYRRRVPLGAPLSLTVARSRGALTYRLADGAHVLVDGHVAPCPIDRPAPAAHGHTGDGHELPVSRTCFACGTDNPLGLRLRLAFDDATVHGRWRPLERFRDDEGGLAPVALTTLLDEAAFWLGALTTGESGMTTDLRVTLHHPVPVAAAITVIGRRAEVRTKTDDGRYCVTRLAAFAEDGGVAATAQITFVAVRGAAKRLVTGLLAMNDAAVLHRVFPAYTSTR